MNKNPQNKKQMIIVLMIGVLLTLLGVIGLTGSPEVTDTVMLVSGLVMVGAGLYRMIA